MTIINDKCENMKLNYINSLIQMQNYYLHNQSSPSFRLNNLTSFRLNEEEDAVIGIRGTQLEMYKLINDDLTYCKRFVFHANLEKI